MIKNLISIVSHFFNFRKLRFADLRYADFVIEGKAFFIVSWRIENGYRLDIKALHYRTYTAAGSAYVAVPEGVVEVELVASNFWYSKRRVAKLIRERIASQTDFFPVKRFEDMTVPQLKLSLSMPVPRPPAFPILIQNLNKT